MSTQTVVWKYEIDGASDEGIEMPRGADLLHVAIQHGGLCLWARVDPEAPIVRRKITVAMTGERIDGLHVGTLLLHNGTLVLHVFDGGEFAATTPTTTRAP